MIERSSVDRLTSVPTQPVRPEPVRSGPIGPGPKWPGPPGPDGRGGSRLRALPGVVLGEPEGLIARPRVGARHQVPGRIPPPVVVLVVVDPVGVRLRGDGLVE